MQHHLRNYLFKVRYHREDRTYLALAKATPDRKVRSLARVGSFHWSDSAGGTIVTIEPPSSDRLSARPLCMYVSSTHTRTRPVQSLLAASSR